jgi:hypothetical protein
LEPDIDDLHALLARESAAPQDAAANLTRATEQLGAEGRALELALATIEALRERGSLTGADVCLLATLHGYDKAAVARAWKTRGEFDLTKKPYELDKPIARVLPLL